MLNIGKLMERNSQLTGFSDYIVYTSNFMNYFIKSMQKVCNLSRLNSLLIAEIGAGIGWTRIIMALNPKVKRVYAKEPSIN